MLSAAVRDNYVDRNRVEHVRRLKTAKKVKPFLQLDPVDALVEATDERHRPLVLTLLLAGLRIGEALAPTIARANEQLALQGRPAIPRLTPHSLRHTYCSLLIGQGEDLATVAAQMRATPTRARRSGSTRTS